MSKNSIRIPPFHYIHVLDRNTNVTRLEIGPQTFIRQDHEKVSTGENPIKMVVLQPRTYCEITNPVVRDNKGELVFDKHGQVTVKFGETEYRFFEKYPEPFPLYPKEELTLAPKALLIVKELTAIKLEAIRNFVDENGDEHMAGDEWLIEGPCTYYPRIEEKVVMTINSQVISEGHALRLKAKQSLVDKLGNARKAGEEWLVRSPGSYLPGIFEEVCELQRPFILNNSRAIYLRASQNFVDVYKHERKAGEEWLITIHENSHHVLDIYEEFVKIINITVLTPNQYCIVLNPVDPKTGKNRLGARELRKGELCFFLQPGEDLEGGIKEVFLLEENEALLLKAKEAVDDHKPGDRWMVHGPCKYIPPIEVDVVETRKVIPLDKNEGIYVKDTRDGTVRSVIGQAYMLKAHEELYDLPLSDTVENLLQQESFNHQKRIKYKLVTYKCPFNSAVQVYDFRKKSSRIVFGPNLVVLGPDEQFTVTVLSGGKPKRAGVITTFQIQLGPDFTSDIVVVETSDHASLK